MRRATAKSTIKALESAPFRRPDFCGKVGQKASEGAAAKAEKRM
jgi:hypothetical protein